MGNFVNEMLIDRMFRSLTKLGFLTWPVALIVASFWGTSSVDFEIPPLLSALSVIPLVLLLHVGSNAVTLLVTPHLSYMLKPEQTVQQRERFVKRIWKLIEICVLVCLGGKMLENKPFFPVSLGGNGSVHRFFDSEVNVGACAPLM